MQSFSKHHSLFVLHVWKFKYKNAKHQKAEKIRASNPLCLSLLQVYVRLRPFFREFLERMSQIYEVKLSETTSEHHILNCIHLFVPPVVTLSPPIPRSFCLLLLRRCMQTSYWTSWTPKSSWSGKTRTMSWANSDQWGGTHSFLQCLIPWAERGRKMDWRDGIGALW